ncbi:MAG: M20/M25/M40 family metallo-hydrolase [Bryobacteraceae bacterium]|jgi:acetylornithine deacetylase|nr:M20/M25/M40 family metallo-hydrolase [Bryobacteraceae bacterium]
MRHAEAPWRPELEQELLRYVDVHSQRLIAIAQELVRIPSENTPPTGSEKPCQEYVFGFLRDHGWEPVMYSLTEVPGLVRHPLYWPGRDYSHRPNVGARRRGLGGGRSLVLSGHVDTVPRGTQPWTRDPFGAEIEDGRLYGRGANDMKAGVAANLFVVEALEDLGLRLAGDLVFESVVDEEFGGVNGTLASRLMGFNAEAAVITEPTSLRVCPAQRGGRTAHIRLRAPGGILSENNVPRGVESQLRHVLEGVEEFRRRRRAAAKVHPYYEGSCDPVPVSVTKVYTGPWGTGEPITVPETAWVEIYWQTMPGETQEEVEREFFQWLEELPRQAPEHFPVRPQVEFPIRWLPGSAIVPTEPVVEELRYCSERALGRPVPVAGIEGPCDMYVFHQGFGIPAVLWGPRGGNTHAADEYVEVASLVAATRALLLFVCRWCGVE